MIEFLRKTDEKMEIKYVFLDFYNKSKKISVLIFLVVRLQKVNRFRIFAFKNRMAYLKYYWENMKSDLAKVLMTDKKNAELSKALSIKIFSVREEIRDVYLNWYVAYSKEIYTLTFIMWRMRKLKALGHPFTFEDWDT